MTDDIIIDHDLSLPRDFHYTQSKLRDFEDCPRRFYLKYIVNQRWPSPLAKPQNDIEVAMRRGQRFHRLIERHRLGISLETLRRTVGEDEVMQGWLQRYEALLPRLGKFDREQAEVILTTSVADFPLLAKFDLLGLQGQSISAIDWKTGWLPPEHQLARRMQTIVYLYVLYQEAATWLGHVRISNYTLTYVGLRNSEIRSFGVDADNISAIAERIRSTIEAIAQSDFAKVESDHPCRYCIYRSLCNRGVTPYLEDDIFDEKDDGYWNMDILGEIEF